jgi:UDP-N-acetylglucosamine diphosphorylase/glucosamine-1-phosphate N-acetyltransferase
MKTILFDHPEIRVSLLPLTYTRPVAAIRCGIFTIGEKWAHYLKQPVSFYATDYLQEKYPFNVEDDNLMINGAVLPDANLAMAVKNLGTGEALKANGILVAARADRTGVENMIESGFVCENLQLSDIAATLIQNTWDIFHFNGDQIRADYSLVTQGRKSEKINDPHTIVYAGENIFIEEGVKIRAAIFNAENGPIYLGKNTEIQEGAIIKGPLALGEGSVVTLGAKLRSDSTFGPYCKVGGEISNSVIFGYTSKGHEGFMGNSVIGEWCNIGADTNTSNLKNNLKPVKVWSYLKDQFVNSGLQFCGLTMGDHSKCGINTMFNTGTVVGVSANIFGAGYPRTLIPSFAWGGAAGFATFDLKQAFEVAEMAMKRRNVDLGEADINILKHIYEISARNRVWEKFGGN